MQVHLAVANFMEYTTWERECWCEWFRKSGSKALMTDSGPHGDGRFQVVGDLVRHIFSAEKRYVDRIWGRALTQTASIPHDDVDTLFSFGRESRAGLEQLLETFPAAQWDVPLDIQISNTKVRVTPRKIVIHVLLHETRHWAQIATILRFRGFLADGFHDFIVSPVLSA